MNNNKIIYKRTLNEYNKRYRHHKNLLKFTKKEVEEFDRHANTVGEHYLLRNNNWWLIGDTFYQAPKTLHHYWFRNLNAGAQTAICLLGAGIVATSATLPFVIKHNNVDEGGEVIIDPSKENEAKIEVVSKSSAGVIYKVSPKDSSKKVVTGIESVTIGNDILVETEEYTYKINGDSVSLTIKQEAFSKHSGPVRVLPITETPKEKKIILDPLSLTLEVGEESKTITATLKGLTGDVQFESEDESVAIVEKTENNIATIKPVAKGFTKIVASLDGETANCGIVVKEGVVELPGYLKYKNLGDNKIAIKANSEAAQEDFPEELKIASKYKINGVTKTVTEIAEWGFHGYSFSYGNVKRIILPDTIIKINDNAFNNLNTLTYINIPSSVTEIGERALARDYGSFASEPKITIDIEKGSQLKTIGKSAFTKMSFESITIPASVTTIGDYCFFGCENLTSVNFENQTGWKQIIGGESIDVSKSGDNATNLRNCEKTAPNNWGYTGITTLDVIKKDDWIKKADELVLTGANAICNSNLEYNVNQLTYKINDVTEEFFSFEYYGSGQNRILSVRTSAQTITFAGKNFSGTSLGEKLNKDGIFEIGPDEIVYKYDDAVGEEEYKELHINKYGYPTYQKFGDDNVYESIYKGDPEIYHNIDWATEKFGEEGSKVSLHDMAKTATSIKFIQTDNPQGTLCGETDDDLVYFTLADGVLELSSKNKIRFNDSDYGTDGIFYECSEVTEFDFSNIDTSKVTDFSSCFEGCSKITTLDLANFNTFNAQYMHRMFIDCGALESINNILFNTKKVETFEHTFRGCEKLTSLDISSFNTSNAKEMSYMFYGCGELVTIYASENFKTDAVVNSEGIFSGCEKIKGGKGTTYLGTDIKYACIDEGAGKPGYFTEVSPEMAFFKIYAPWYNEFVNSTKTYAESGITSLRVDGVETPVEEIVYDGDPRYAQIKYYDIESTLCDFTIAGDDNSPENLKIYLDYLKALGYNIITLINDNPGETIGLKVSNGTEELEFVYNKYGYVEKGVKLVNSEFVRLELEYDGEPK